MMKLKTAINWQKGWIAQIHWGFSKANERDFSELAHIVASHHGIKDFGALVEPQTKKAYLFHEVDTLSSSLGMISVTSLLEMEIV